jgi:hypothetical protein
LCSHPLLADLQLSAADRLADAVVQMAMRLLLRTYGGIVISTTAVTSPASPYSLPGRF